MSDVYPYRYDPDEPYDRPPVRITVTPPPPPGSLADQSLPIPKNNTLPEVEHPDLITRMLPTRDPRVPISDLQAQQSKLAFGTTRLPGEKRGFGAIDLTPMGSIAQVGEAIEKQDPFSLAGSFAPGGTLAGAAAKFAPAMFIGPGAKIANQQTLKHAKQMLKEGRAASEIRDITSELDPKTMQLTSLGWEPRAYGKWRTEISDADAQINPQALQMLPMKDQSTLNVGFRLSSLFNHPELYKAYPHLADTEVWKLPANFRGRGMYDPDLKRVYLNEKLSPQEARDVLLHELQHSVQDFERFSEGGSRHMPSVKRKGAEIYNEVLASNHKRFNDLAAQLRAYSYSGKDGKSATELAKEWVDKNPALAKDFAEAKQMIDNPVGASRFVAYQRMIGEVEARDTARRADMTTMQRFARRNTEDIPKEQQWQYRMSRKGDDAQLDEGSFAPGSIFKPQAPAIISPREPLLTDINAIKRAARQYGRKGWPTAEREIFSTSPEAYAETTKLVPQFSIRDTLPGPVEGRPLPMGGRVAPVISNQEEIANRIAERLDPMVRRNDETLKFYHTGPVIRGLQDVAGMGPTQANMFMRRWAGQGAATSPRTQTPPNLRNSSYLMYRREQGDPLTPERQAEMGNTPGFPMMGMHTDLANKFASGTADPWKNPKPFTFRENWSGNLADVTGDTHNIRSTLYELDRVNPGKLPRGWFTNDASYSKYRKEGFLALDPGDIVDTLASQSEKGVTRQAEYLPMTAPWYGAAKKLGIAPAEAQSGGWFSYGPITGLQSPPKTIVNLLNDQIEATAKALNVPHEKVLQWWAQGKIPLAGVAGAGIVGGLAAQDAYKGNDLNM